MTDASFTNMECAQCGDPLSMEVGIVNYGPEGDSKLYCSPCKPQKGYTLADLQAMKEENAVTRAARDVHLMDQLGPDVYFHMRGEKP